MARRHRPARVLGAILLSAATLAAIPAGARERVETHRTETIELRAMSAERAAALYEKVIGTDSETRIMGDEGGRRLIVYDRIFRLERFRELLSLLDQRYGAEMHIYVRPVVYVSPSDLAAMISEVMGEQVRALVPLDGQGKLVVVATRRSYRKVDRFVRRVDRPLPDRGRVVRVVPGS